MDWRGDVISLMDDLIAGYEHQFLLVDYDPAKLTAVDVGDVTNRPTAIGDQLNEVSEKSKKENDDKDASEKKENDDKDASEKKENDDKEGSEKKENDANDASEKNESDAKDVSEINESDAKEVSKKNENEDDANDASNENEDDANDASNENEDDANDASNENKDDANDASDENEDDANVASNENENDVKHEAIDAEIVGKANVKHKAENNDENDIEKETEDKQALEIDADEDNVEKILKLLNYIADWKKLKVKREPEEVKVLANKSEDRVKAEAKIDSKDPINAKQEQIEYLIEIKSEALDEIKREDSAVARLAAAEADARAADANTKERDANKLRKGVYAYKELNAYKELTYKELTYKKLAAHTFEVSPDLTESHCSWPVSVGFLDSTGGGGRFASSLGGQLLPGGLASGSPRIF